MNKSHESRISLWLDKNLAKILKNQKNKNKLNQELKQFFQRQNLCTNVEVTLDSHPEIQNMIKLLSKLDNEAKKILDCLDLCINPLIDLGIDIFYEGDDDNSCDRLSAYYGSFNERLKEIKKINDQNKFYSALQEESFRKKIIQIEKFYHLNNRELDKFNKKQLIIYLLKNIYSNKDIVYFLDYKNIRNQFGKRYTKASIAKKRYILKKNLEMISKYGKIFHCCEPRKFQ